MLKIDLVQLEREKSLRIDAEIPADDPLWGGTELDFDGPLRVRATASLAGSGEVVVRGVLEGELRQECRRCLEEVRTDVGDDLTLVFSPRDELADTVDPEVRVIGPQDESIDLGEAIREELILDVDRFVVCEQACKGICPQCGVDLNVEECDCTLDEPDPRWDALRALKND